MSKRIIVAVLAATVVFTAHAGFCKTPATQRTGPAMIVIVFKDGHRQSFNLSEVARIEFTGAAGAVAEAPATNSPSPLRDSFVGKWEVGDGSGKNFYITLEENGDAERSLADERGKWVYGNGEAHVTWNDGAQDAIRKVGSRYQKSAYHSGKSFTDLPDNVTSAYNTTPRPM